MSNLDDVIHEMKKMQEEILMLKGLKDYCISEIQALNSKFMNLRYENEMLNNKMRKLTNPEEFI